MRAAPSDRGLLSDFLRRTYRAENERAERVLVYHFDRKGLFLELRRLANAMAYAAANDLQLVTDSSAFAYGHRWSDYFEPCCPELTPRLAYRAVSRVGGGASDGSLNGEVYWYKPERLKLGPLTLEGSERIKKLMVMLQFDLNEGTRRAVEAILEPLELPERYVAVQIRRGEKLVNGEGEYHAARDYLSRFPDLESMDAVFVMSDDHRAVDEADAYLVERRLPCRLVTLVRKEDQGLHFARFLQDTQGAEPRSDVRTETLRLLAETTAVTGAQAFVGAWDTNVAHGLHYLHPDPSRCALI